MRADWILLSCYQRPHYAAFRDWPNPPTEQARRGMKVPPSRLLMPLDPPSGGFLFTWQGRSNWHRDGRILYHLH